MRFILFRLARAVRRAKIPFFVLCVLIVAFFVSAIKWMHSTYPQMAAEARAEEMTFWRMADKLTAEDRAALLNYGLRTGKLPRVLPWWEHDRHMCSAVVV